MRHALRPLCLVAMLPLAAAEPESQAQVRTLNLDAFLAEVLKTNLEVAATRFNVTSAEAQVALSRLVPDPTLTAGIGSKELYGPNKPGSPTQLTASLGWTLELGGKRAARMASAASGLHKAQADLTVFLEDLRSTAAGAYIDLGRARDVLTLKRQLLAGHREILQMNERRHAAGDIGGVELAQARVEARRFEAEVAQSEADLRVAEGAVAQLLGPGAGKVQVEGSLEVPGQDIAPETVRQAALAHRPDLVAARRALEVAGDQVKVAQANRWVDLGLSVGVTHTPPLYATGLDAGGAPFPSPASMSNTLNATVSLPIPFSRRVKGELAQAQAGRSQARLQLEALERRTLVDVDAALAQHEAALRQLRLYQDDIVKDATKVLEGMRFSYRKGAVSLMELILAQRTQAEVLTAHLDARAAHAKALAALDRVTGGMGFLVSPR